MVGCQRADLRVGPYEKPFEVGANPCVRPAYICQPEAVHYFDAFALAWAHTRLYFGSEVC